MCVTRPYGGGATNSIHRGCCEQLLRTRGTNARQEREHRELDCVRSTRVCSVMVELLLDTDCTLRELCALRWTDIMFTRQGLQLMVHGRVQPVVDVDDSLFHGVPQVSMWVFEGISWSRLERRWRSTCRKLHLPEDLFA
jgi:hypothetical protein